MRSRPSFGTTIDLDRLRPGRTGVVSLLTGVPQPGWPSSATYGPFTGQGSFAPLAAGVSPPPRSLEHHDQFRSGHIAVRIGPVPLPFLPPGDPRIVDSTGALALSRVPERLLVSRPIIASNATSFIPLGARSPRRLLDQIIPGADPDLVFFPPPPQAAAHSPSGETITNTVKSGDDLNRRSDAPG